MEKNFKRLFCALLGLGLSTSVFASSAVVVPSQHGGFKVGVDALYLRPGNSDLDYAVLTTFPSDPSVSSSSNRINLSVHPGYSAGFYAQLGYLIPCTGNDVTLGYTSLQTHDTDGAVLPAGFAVDGFSIVPLSIFGSSAAVFSANSKATFDLSVVDLELGQRFTTGSYDTRMFAGLRYADIEHQLYAEGVNGFTSANLLIITEGFTSHYRGIGPRIGVDGRYCLQSGFGIDANVSTSLLVGKIDPKFQGFLPLSLSEQPNTVSQVSNGSRSRIVPVLEAKLGMDYTYIVNRCAKAAVIFEAGYQVANYFNAIEHAAIAAGGLFLPVATSTTDVTFHGPYFGVKYYA